MCLKEPHFRPDRVRPWFSMHQHRMLWNYPSATHARLCWRRNHSNPNNTVAQLLWQASKQQLTKKEEMRPKEWCCGRAGRNGSCLADRREPCGARVLPDRAASLPWQLNGSTLRRPSLSSYLPRQQCVHFFSNLFWYNVCRKNAVKECLEGKVRIFLGILETSTICWSPETPSLLPARWLLFLFLYGTLKYIDELTAQQIK